MSDRSGNDFPSVTIAPAPTRQFLPITAPFITTAWMPISEPSPTVQPCSIAWWPTVTRSPIVERKARVGVQHRAFLDVGLGAEHDRLVVAARARPCPETRTLADDDVADQRRRVGDVGRAATCGVLSSIL